MVSKLKVGDIVTVVSESSQYDGKQGRVAEIVDDGDEDGPVGVRFHPRQMMQYVCSEDECVVRHKEAELEVNPSWNVATRAEHIYSGSHHSVYELKFEFDPKSSCMHEGCSSFALKRCIINVWGTVQELDFCEAHSEVDGMLLELTPPLKKEYVPVGAPKKKKAA